MCHGSPCRIIDVVAAGDRLHGTLVDSQRPVFSLESRRVDARRWPPPPLAGRADCRTAFRRDWQNRPELTGPRRLHSARRPTRGDTGKVGDPAIGMPRRLDHLSSLISDVLFATILVVRIATFIQLRKRFGFTQAQLARKLGVHRVTVTNWERGAAGIPGPVARLLRRLDADRRAKKRAR